MATITPIVVDLDTIASEIHDAVAQYRAAEGSAIEAQLTVGRLLAQARAQLTSNQEYGAWMVAQAFGFSPRWANTLCRAAENEPAVLDACRSQLLDGGQSNIEKAVRTALPPAPRAVPDPGVVPVANASGGTALGAGAYNPDDPATALAECTSVVSDIVNRIVNVVDSEMAWHLLQPNEVSWLLGELDNAYELLLDHIKRVRK